MSELNKILVGGLVTILVSGVTFFISDYRSLLEYKQKKEELNAILEEKRELEKTNRRIDSLYNTAVVYRKKYELHIKHTMDSLIKSRDEGRLLTDKALRESVYRPDSLIMTEKQNDSIYRTLPRRP
jgi:hypothetical protein